MFADRNRLFQVFNILMVNAAEAMGAEPESKPKILKVSTSDKRFLTVQNGYVEGVLIEIQDTGCGISEDNIHKLRDPFFTTKCPTGGKNSGLGLSILYEVVDMHGGKVEVSSVEGVQTTFKIYIPCPV